MLRAISRPCSLRYSSQLYIPTSSRYLSKMTDASHAFAQDFVDFLNESCTPFHAVAASKARLLSAGFSELNESHAWDVKPGGRYFFTRNGTTVVAISVGKDYAPENGFTVVAAHTDSPCLRIKPVPCITRSDALMLNTQPYGGGLWHTWFDRDLGIAGKIIFRTPEGGLDSKLIVINKPVARIPNLAIHLTAQADREKFGPNLHSHAKAILTMDPALMSASSGNPRFHAALMNLISAEAGVNAESVVEMDLQLIDVQPSTLGGINNEFLYSGRLDNLCSAYQCLRAIIDEAAEAGASGRSDPSVKVAMLFDHEEVGSESAQGAGSTLFMDTLRSLHEALVPGAAHGAFMRSLRKSYVVSIDMAHALHPNYTDKHDSSMAPVINGGLVVKHNCNQRYATSAASATYFRECARLEGVPVQEFSVRSDSGCGTTVGPILATLSGIMTVDCGSPQFSMHSIRETMGSKDPFNGYNHLKAVMKHFPALSASAPPGGI